MKSANSIFYMFGVPDTVRKGSADSKDFTKCWQKLSNCLYNSHTYQDYVETDALYLLHIGIVRFFFFQYWGLNSGSYLQSLLL
jgi:hypothetical protein